MSNIQDLKHRRGTGDCYEQLVNERKISDTLERELNEAKSDVARLVRENNQRIDDFYESYARCEIERDEARHHRNCVQIELTAMGLRLHTCQLAFNKEASLRVAAETERDIARVALRRLESEIARRKKDKIDC